MMSISPRIKCNSRYIITLIQHTVRSKHIWRGEVTLLCRPLVFPAPDLMSANNQTRARGLTSRNIPLFVTQFNLPWPGAAIETLHPNIMADNSHLGPL